MLDSQCTISMLSQSQLLTLQRSEPDHLIPVPHSGQTYAAMASVTLPLRFPAGVSRSIGARSAQTVCQTWKHEGDHCDLPVHVRFSGDNIGA